RRCILAHLAAARRLRFPDRLAGGNRDDARLRVTAQYRAADRALPNEPDQPRLRPTCSRQGPLPHRAGCGFLIRLTKTLSRCAVMNSPRQTAIVTGASQGIGAGIAKGFVERGFNVVANALKMTQSTEVAASNHVALVDGDIGESATAARIVETALARFKSIDVLVNNAGIFITKPFTDYTAEDFKS